MQGLEPIDFAQNLNPLGPPSSVSRIELNFLEECKKYGDAHAGSVRAAAAKAFGVDDACIGIGLGATQILFALPRMLGKDRAVIPSPSFWEYGVAHERAGIPTEYINLRLEDGFTLDVHQLSASLVTPAAVYLSNVCNPTSRLTDKQALLSLVSSQPNSAFVVDETYLLFREDFSEQTLVPHVSEHQNLFVVHSLSKVFSLPGMRIGLLFARPDAVSKYESAFSFPYGISTSSARVVCTALEDTDFLATTGAFMTKERQRLASLYAQELNGRLKLVAPDGNFILAQLSSPHTNEDLHERLYKEFGVVVRKGSEIPGLDDSWIRFCIRTEKENDRLVEALSALVSS